MNRPPQGFWAQAAADPDRTVLIAPDGEEWTAGRLHADANRLVHGLRAAGMERGDAFAVVLPNGAEFLTAYLAASQAGFYMVPVNHHLVGPEIAWIVSDSGAKVLLAHERYADAARDAADEARLPADRRYAVGTAEGFRPYAELLDGQPESAPTSRTLGLVMNYTSGTTGRPRGIRRPLPGRLPEESHLGGFLGIFGRQPVAVAGADRGGKRQVGLVRFHGVRAPARRLPGQPHGGRPAGSVPATSRASRYPAMAAPGDGGAAQGRRVVLQPNPEGAGASSPGHRGSRAARSRGGTGASAQAAPRPRSPDATRAAVPAGVRPRRAVRPSGLDPTRTGERGSPQVTA